MAEKRTIKIKLLVNKETKKLVFTECDKDFVEILFSFLTLPISTIIRLSPKNKSDLGSMDSLYGTMGSLKISFLKPQTANPCCLHPMGTDVE
ncbi:hypothetical protein ACHQM5_009557 [Ranunculus cassubicifolius]